MNSRTDVDWANMEMQMGLPDGFYQGNNEPVPEELIGAQILTIQSAPQGSCEGGLVINVLTADHRFMRVVFAFTEEGMWVEHVGEMRPSFGDSNGEGRAPSAILRDCTVHNLESETSVCGFGY
jgi:hypothetical protein